MTRSEDFPSTAGRVPLRRARVDLGAVYSNMAILGPDYVVDLSGGAYGHGFDQIAATVLDAGASRFVVENESDERRLRAIAKDRPIFPERIDCAPDAATVYGVSSVRPLAPVMRVSASVISTKRFAAGDPVSYGYTWRAPTETTVALVGIGYSDGISRRASNRGSAYLRGIRPIVGRIAMDVLSIDIGDDEAEAGDEVVLFGFAPASAWAWAEHLGVPALSVTSGIGCRVPREYLGRVQ